MWCSNVDTITYQSNSVAQRGQLGDRVRCSLIESVVGLWLRG